MAAEIGATQGWAHFNVNLAATMLREAAALTTQVSGEMIPSDRPGCLSFTARRPAGLVLGIAPWNAPVILGVSAVATPLACGNTVVLKASEICPATHRLIGEGMREAGPPPGVINVVTHAPSAAAAIVAALIAHRAVLRITFTGSTHVGRIIARLAADQLKPVLLELGGKAPLIVLDDADLDEAAAAAAFGADMNSGQICMSTEKIIVDRRVGESFVTRFRAKVATLSPAIQCWAIHRWVPWSMRPPLRASVPWSTMPSHTEPHCTRPPPPATLFCPRRSWSTSRRRCASIKKSLLVRSSACCVPRMMPKRCV